MHWRRRKDCEHATAVSTAAMDRAARAGVRTSTAVHVGRTAEAICCSAETVDADLVVVGARVRGALKAALLGSISRRVARMSLRVVVIVGGARRLGVLIDHAAGASAGPTTRPEDGAAARVLARGMFG
jgi:nucleotide-binding universal stress UspA family protein